MLCYKKGGHLIYSNNWVFADNPLCWSWAFVMPGLPEDIN